MSEQYVTSVRMKVDGGLKLLLSRVITLTGIKPVIEVQWPRKAFSCSTLCLVKAFLILLVLVANQFAKALV